MMQEGEEHIKGKKPEAKVIVGWVAIAVSILTACFWAFWGIIENFHEGWYHASFAKNIGLMFVQYLAPMIITILLTLISIFNHRIGAVVFLVVGAWLSYFVNNPIASVPFIILGLLHWFSDFKPKKWKYRLILILPLLTLIVCGIEPIYHVSGRVNDGDFGKRSIVQNGVALEWAPRGPGWPDDGANWFEADSICTYLMKDGITIASEPQNIWRLPTVEEVARSAHRHGENAGGRLDVEGNPEYDISPDKETPLWNPHTKVIYWWTNTEIDDEKAYIIVYDGKIWERRKSFGPNYLGFRAVRDINESN